MLSSDNLLEILNSYNNISILISLGISIIIALLGVVPSVFVTAANILFFGPVYGFFISLLGETIGAFITFYLYRFGFKKAAVSLKGKYNFVDRLLVSSGKRAFILVLETRLIPFIPSGFVTLAASVSNMRIIPFIVATFLGKIPSILLEAIVSYDLINIEENFIRLLITIISLILLFFTIRKKSF